MKRKLPSPLGSFLIFLLLNNLFAQIRFAWITDTHIGSPDADKDLIQIINDINQKDLKFVILTGDITEKGQNSELIQAKEILNNLNKPYFIIPGNHDTKWSESGCTKFSKLFGDNKFFFQLDNFYFIGLNSGIPLRGGGGHISIEDLQWLNSKLENLNREANIIFAVHHQLNQEIDNFEEVISILSKFNNVLVIVGHGHSNKAYNFNGLNGVMGRSSLRRNQNPGYNIVTLANDSVYIQTIDFNENKFWYKNSLKTNSTQRINRLENIKEQSTDIKLIFSAKSTLVKTGVVHQKRIYFSDLSGFVYSIDLKGKLIWKQYLKTPFFSRPLIYQNLLIFCGADGCIYLIDRNSGKLIISINLSSPIIATPIIHKNFLIVFSNNGMINFIDLKNKKIESVKIAEKNFESIPLLFDEKVIIGNWDGYLYALNVNPIDSNIIFWKWTENKNFYYSPAACSPLIDRFNRIIISTPDKFISLIDSKSGRTILRTNEFNSWESIGIDEEKKTLFIKSLIDTLYALTLDSLKLKWKTNLSYGLDTNPINLIVNEGKVFVPSKNGFLYILDSKSGKLLNQYFLGNSRLNDVIVLNSKTVIVSNMDGKIFMVKVNKRVKRK